MKRLLPRAWPACLPALSALCLFATVAFGQTFARVTGVVQDEEGNPLPGVEITVSDPEGAFEKEYTTNKKGRYTVGLADATRPYLYRLEKEGYATHEEVYKAPVGSMEQKDFVLRSADAPAVATETQPAGPTGEPAVDAFNEGAEAFQHGEYEVALEKFLRAEELDPDLEPLPSALARAYLQTGRYDEALEAAAQILESNPSDQTALTVRYRAYEALGDEKRAKEAERELARLSEPHVLAYNTGVEALREGNLEQAGASFRQAIELAPDLVPAHAALASVYLKQGRYEEALAAAEETLALEPENLNALGVRYDSLRGLGREEEAEAARLALAAAAPDVMVQNYFEAGLEHFNANRVEEAKAALLEVLALDPDHARAHYILGLAHANAGESAQAKEHLQRFLELAPDDPDAVGAREMLEFL